MKSTLRLLVPRSLMLLSLGLLAPSVGGCGSVVTGPGAGGAGGGGGGACTLEPPGKSFTFHVFNSSKQVLTLAFGCGHTLPIAIETAGGKLRIGPGNGDGSECEYTCEQIYSGGGMNPCTGCGAGVGVDLSPGVTADIVWDRRVYTDFVPPAECLGEGAGSCGLGKPVAATSTQKGVLTVCADNQGTPLSGDCSEQGSLPVSFEVDTTKDEVTISYP